ncbi:hypothetical protein MNV49_004691 [Pseudohyphozyma bogoriensis]|nr:hypothetical protein MNV49_004691 [Pseudohyphozyma bogoriensis]
MFGTKAQEEATPVERPIYPECTASEPSVWNDTPDTYPKVCVLVGAQRFYFTPETIGALYARNPKSRLYQDLSLAGNREGSWHSHPIVDTRGPYVDYLERDPSYFKVIFQWLSGLKVKTVKLKDAKENSSAGPVWPTLDVADGTDLVSMRVHEENLWHEAAFYGIDASFFDEKVKLPIE